MIGEPPEADFVLMAGQGAHLDVDRVIADGFVPRLDLNQGLAGLALALASFVDLDTSRRRDQTAAGLLSEHRGGQPAARHEPGIGWATGTRRLPRRRQGFRAGFGKPQGYECYEHGQRRNHNPGPWR